MITSLTKAFAQFSDPAFKRVAIRGFIYSVVLSIVLVWGASYGIGLITFFEIGWINDAIAFLGSAAAVVLAILLFPGLAATVISFMLDSICKAVEAKHYTDLPPAREIPLAEEIFAGVRLVLVTVILNVIFLPLYLVPVVNVIVFYGLNGYLLGREYFELVALRRMPAGEARDFRKRHRNRYLTRGIVIAALLSIPFVNWIMAVPSVAFMLHEFERERRREAA